MTDTSEKFSVGTSADQTVAAGASDALSPETPLLQYRIIRQVGSGGMGVVYLARDTELDRDVALKVLRIDAIAPAEMPRFQDRFVREARSAARLSHPNVASIFQVGRADSRLFLAMEWLEGGSLADYLSNHLMLDWREATVAVRDAAAGLAAAHAAGLVHRDIKPSNLMRTRAGLVKLVDFGLARDFAEEPELTTAGVILGTPSYLSPEQCRGERATPQSDIYSLACTWFHLLTSRPPFHAHSLPGILHQHIYEPLPDPGRFAEQIPENVRRILAKAAAKEPAERYASADALLADLHEVLDPRPRPIPVTERSPSAATTRPAALENQHGVVRPGTAAVATLRSKPRLLLAAGAVLTIAVIVVLVGWRAGWFDRSPAVADTPRQAPPPPAASPLTRPAYTNPIGLEFVRIAPATFLMGSPADEPGRFEDETLHQVKITRPFYLATTKVTQRQWKHVMGANPSHFIGDDLPVEQITYTESLEFCRRLGALDGRTYRLPTEAEWECAARAGTTTPFSIGSTISTELANYNGITPSGSLSSAGVYREQTTPVKQFPSNRAGLYDIQGNVLDLCQDWYGPYPLTPVTDPHGPESGEQHVARGGCWPSIDRWCRAAARGKVPHDYRTDRVGLRLVVEAGE